MNETPIATPKSNPKNVGTKDRRISLLFFTTPLHNYNKTNFIRFQHEIGAALDHSTSVESGRRRWSCISNSQTKKLFMVVNFKVSTKI
jgi:hypothetical protein